MFVYRQTRKRETRESEDPEQFFPFFGEYLSRTRRPHSEKEKEKERQENVRDQRRTVIYNGRGWSP